MRTTLAAVGVVGLALVVGAVALVVSLRRSLTSDLETALELRARDVVSALEAGTDPGELTADRDEDSFVQVVDARGRVVAASPQLVADAPVADPGRRGATEVEGVQVEEAGEVEAEDFLVVSRVAETPEGRRTVLVGRTLEFVTESTGFVTGVMLAGVPALIVVVGATAWWLVGRALRPVERIRAEVESVSAAELDRRVPVPPGSDEIALLADTMNRMLGRLEASQARQRRFVSDASHELRSPLAALRQHAEVAATHPERSSLAELAGVARAEGERLERLVDDLLLLARADEHRLTTTNEPVDLDDLVFEEADRLRAATALGVDTRSVSAVRVHGDAAWLRRVVGNLAENAARHAGSTVAFTLRADGGGEAVLAVDDDGPGVPPGDRERVFERFVRLDAARARDAGGAGLGLSIVAEIVRAYGGTVAVTDSVLGGARFEVKLPVPQGS